MIEDPVVEQVKPIKKLKQMRFDEELAFKLQAEEEEEERLAREKAHKLKNHKVLGICKMFVQFLERRNKSRTHGLKRIYRVGSSRRVESSEDEGLDRNKAEENSKKAEAEIAQESSSKRAGEELEQESSKKQKVEEDKESEELKQCLEIVPDDGDDVTINATPLSIKSPTIERIVGIKRILDDLRVTADKLMLLVYKLLLLVLKVNAASTKVRTVQRLRLLKEFLLSEKG
ncbi:hypothetical protein Tco_1321419 [Tanacetum coccineum]